MKYWTTKFRTVQKDEKDVKVGIVAANNHYAGFGGATANMFRVMNNLPSIEWVWTKILIIMWNYTLLMEENLNLNKRLCLIIQPLSITHFQIRCRYTSCNSFVRVYQKNAFVSHGDRQRTHPI
ncbi:MAG: hypothetical protein QOA20_10690 [Nitrososphaeraceae archaeon]|nr:hypothetical protein [Nitrososphaeraceae archaeon]